MSLCQKCGSIILGVWLALLVVGCQLLPEPPRLATATAQAALPPTPTLEPLHLPVAGSRVAAPPLPLPAADANPTLTLWVNETSAAHRKALATIAAGFEAEQGVNVEVMFVSPNLLPDLVELAAITDTYDLPDVIIHPIEYSIGWAERGILDTEAAETAVTNLGRDTFNPFALDLLDTNGQVAAIPSDGYQQLLIYRTDWFAEQNLAVPDNFAAMLAAAEATHDPENLRSGFVIPTESNLRTTQEAFEHLAAANGCQLINEAGEVLLTSPECRETITFYFDIVHQFSPIGVQTDTSMRNAYLEGRTGMIIGPPTILPQLAGLDVEHLPTCPECGQNQKHLAANSGIITVISGKGDTSANFGKMTNLGITRDADRETAVAFAEYWFNQGYPTWLAVESERKVPLRQGLPEDLTRFIASWGLEPLSGSDQSLADIYGEEIVVKLKEGVAQSNRWGISQGQGGVISDLYRELTFSVILQEMLSGYFTPDKTLYQAYQRVVEFLPDYAFEILAEPTPILEPEA